MNNNTYVKDSYFTIELVDIKEPLFRVSFDLDNIDFGALYNRLKEKDRSVARYILFRKMLMGELVESLTQTLLEDVKDKVLDIINKEYVDGLYGVLDRPASDFIIVEKGVENGKVYFLIKPITKKV